MKQTRLIMGMPITIEIVNDTVSEPDINAVFDYFSYIDKTFSTYKDESEITKINKGLVKETEYSNDMKTVLNLSTQTKEETFGYFDIERKDKTLEPAGLVKGWAIYNAAGILKERGFYNFYIDAGGDIQVSGNNSEGKEWSVGIRNPFNREEIVKVLYIKDKGVATSGTYIRGHHIYNPLGCHADADEIISLTVIGTNIYEADRFATAAFAMGKKGITFIENLKDLEGYMIDKEGIATMTSNFNTYTALKDDKIGENK